MNYQLESRMREIRQSGSEGGGTKSIASPYPYATLRASRLKTAKSRKPTDLM